MAFATKSGGFGLALLGGFVALMLLASPAGATCSSVSPSSSGYTIFYSGSIDGQIQCAGRRTSVDNYLAYDGSSLERVATGKAWGNARKDLFCTNAFGLPAGWINAGAIVQEETSPGVWINLDIGPTTSNLSGSANTPSISPSYASAFVSSQGRTVSVHQTLSAGAWRTNVFSLAC